MRVRFATEEDALALLKIYAQYIDTTVTFEYVLPSEEEFRNRIREYSEMYPYLVCEDHGKIVAYVYAHRAMERAAYQWNAEISIYLDKNYRGKKLGRKLYTLIMEILILQGVRTVYGVVTSPNPRSEKLHEAMGFRLIGVFRDSGFKSGRWCDVSWYEKQIGEYDMEPIPIKSIHELDTCVLQELLDKYENME